MPKNPIQSMLDKSIKALKNNSIAMEKALESFLKTEGVEFSEKEYNELKQLTNTMNELDSVLYSIESSKTKSNKKKVKAKKRKKK